MSLTVVVKRAVRLRPNETCCDSHLNSICQDILCKSKRNLVVRFLSASKDQGDIVEFKEKIDNAIQRFNVESLRLCSVCIG